MYVSLFLFKMLFNNSVSCYDCITSVMNESINEIIRSIDKTTVAVKPDPPRWQTVSWAPDLWRSLFCLLN